LLRHRLVHLLAAHFDTVAAQRQLTYRVQTPPHLFVEIDPARIERVLLNLLSNAFKFTPDGGCITCSLEPRPASEDGSQTPAQVVLCVQDSGPGVPAELREVIFERFRQSEEGAKRRFGGTGLGLAIVKELVSLHGGTIRIDEAPGGGARFTVCLPQRAPAGTHVQREDDTSILGPTDARLLQATVEEVLPAQQAHAGRSSPSPSPESELSLILIVEVLVAFAAGVGLAAFAAAIGERVYTVPEIETALALDPPLAALDDSLELAAHADALRALDV